MAKDRSLVRASDIGSWTFCNRSWWLATIEDVPHQNPAQLNYGDSMHERHGRNVALAERAYRIGLFLIACALFLAAFLLIWQMLL